MVHHAAAVDRAVRVRLVNPGVDTLRARRGRHARGQVLVRVGEAEVVARFMQDGARDGAVEVGDAALLQAPERHEQVVVRRVRGARAQA